MAIVKKLKAHERNQIAQILKAFSSEGKIQHGKIKEIAESFQVSRRTIHNIWAAAKKMMSEGLAIQLKDQRIGMQYKKKQIVDMELMRFIPFEKRSTIRCLAKELKMSKSCVGRLVKCGQIKRHTNAIKPHLTEENKLVRLNYSLNALVVNAESNKISFSEMYNVVHIDEKWFYMSRATERYYMLPAETEPHRTCKSKKFFQKVMFMCGVSRPQYSSDGQLIFDGKIGVFPFIYEVAAKRNSKNRVRGTKEFKPIDSVNKEVIKSCMINQIIPAIKAKWPPNASKDIFIQQDNARPHISNDDPDFRAVASSDGFNIILVCQPPNSPDTNVNDLGWFRAIQSLHLKTNSHSVDDLIKNVKIAYQNLSPVTLNNVFLSLQCCLLKIMEVMGSNNYHIPHLGKAKLIREDMLPISLEVDEELVRNCIQHLIEVDDIEKLTYDKGPLMTFLGH